MLELNHHESSIWDLIFQAMALTEHLRENTLLNHHDPRIVMVQKGHMKVS